MSQNHRPPALRTLQLPSTDRGIEEVSSFSCVEGKVRFQYFKQGVELVEVLVQLNDAFLPD